MTDPDPVAALAAQVTDLCGQLARSQGDIGALRARLEENSGLEATLRLEIKKLRRRLDEADKRRADAPDVPWWGVGADEGRAMLAELREWLEMFFRRHYPGYAARLAPCILNHSEAIWELSTLRAEWERIYGDEENRDLQGALAWHDRFLPGVLNRLNPVTKECVTGCVLVPRRYSA
jgi:regulator of replication initiation timing